MCRTYYSGYNAGTLFFNYVGCKSLLGPFLLVDFFRCSLTMWDVNSGEMTSARIIDGCSLTMWDVNRLLFFRLLRII